MRRDNQDDVQQQARDGNGGNGIHIREENAAVKIVNEGTKVAGNLDAFMPGKEQHSSRMLTINLKSVLSKKCSIKLLKKLVN